MKLALRLALMSALVATTALAVASVATAATPPAPTGFFSGNINSCSTGDQSVEAVLGVTGPWNGANSGSWPATQVSGDGLTVTISNVTTVGGQLVFDWSSNLPVDLAVVKQGPGGAYWLYNASVTSGTLAAYKNGEPSGGVSHVLFCYHPGSQGGDPKLLVSKTAATHITKTYDWSIAKKERDGKTQLNGQVDGPAGTANYEIKVTKELVSTEYSVSGVITVKNDSATNLVAATVTDTLPGATDLVLALPCTGAFALAAGATIDCSYTAKLPNADARTNTAFADSGSEAVADGSGTAAVSFDDSPVTVVNDSIDVSDDFATPGSTSDDKHWTEIDETTTFSYAQAFTCGGTSGSAGFTNIASIDGTAKTASWTVQVICAAKETETPPASTPPASTPPASTPPASTPAATTPPPAVQPPFTPPVAKPKPKPKPKAEKAPAVCTIVTVTQKSIPAGIKAKVTIRLTAAGKPVAGARVRLVGPGINKVVKTGKNGVVSVSVNAKQAGIVTITVVGKKSCSSTRLGVVGTFEPPVTG